MNEKVLHLYQRATFGMSPQQWTKSSRWQPRKAWAQIWEDAQPLHALPAPADLFDEEDIKNLSEDDKKKVREANDEFIRQTNLNWVQMMISHGTLRDKMTLFWHGHFACEPKIAQGAVHYYNTLHTHALGNFRDLVLAIAKESSMILYLNNQQNRKKKPNENFARELFELFTLGRGNYTEQDIKASARAFTGWHTNRRTAAFEFNERQHDADEKTIFGKTGNWNGDDVVNLILQRPECAYFIAKKIYTFFVQDTPNNAHIRTMADAFYKSNYQLETLMRTMFEADWFYDAAIVGNKIKSPIELLVGMAQTLQMQFDSTKSLLFAQRALGQILFHPPNVAGWAGGKTWIDNATLLLRLNLAGAIFQQANLSIETKQSDNALDRKRHFKRLEVSANLDNLLQTFGDTKPELLPQQLATYLLRSKANLDNNTFHQFANQAKDTPNFIKAWVLVLMSLPEYQMN